MTKQLRAQALSGFRFLAALLFLALPVHAQYRSIDGSGNNANHTDWGSVGSLFVFSPSGCFYTDGVSQPVDWRPSTRVISNVVFDQPSSIPNLAGFSDFVWQWGQFIDHDMALTDQNPSDPMNVPVPAGDPYFDPNWEGDKTIAFNRSTYASGTGVTDPRRQVNLLTAWIDGSMVYGSDPTRADWLRADVQVGPNQWKGAYLKATSNATGDLLPMNDGSMANATPAGAPSQAFFVAGDVRANEQVGLTAIHTLFVREHNRLVDEISANAVDLPTDPAQRDQEIYQRARALVGAMIQKITYQDWLPQLLGSGGLPDYSGYNDSVNPDIGAVFSTAAFRVGHTMLSPQLLRLDDQGSAIPEGALSLRDAFFNPAAVTDEGGIDPILKGLASQVMQKIDAKVVDDVRSFLFGPPGSGGFDLVALNTQRGRDHGLPDYNTIRSDLGLLTKDRFLSDGFLSDGLTPNGITDDVTLAADLEALYLDIDDVDAFVGLLSEDPFGDSPLSEVLQSLWVEQFANLRDGDAFYYERAGCLSANDLALVQSATLSDIIMRNTSLTDLPENIFLVPEPATLTLLTLGAFLTLRRRQS